MKTLTLEEWLKKFGGDYSCVEFGPIHSAFESVEAQRIIERKKCSCKNCKQARQDYQAAIAADKKRIEEYERTKPKEQTS